MIELDVRPIFERIERQAYIADSPIDFTTWLELSQLDTELVNGVMVQKMADQFPHEWIFVWLDRTLGSYVDYRELGIVVGSRTAVKINNDSGRLPDLVFVRKDNIGIIHKDAIYGVPDLVIEIISENDRPSDLIPLESDYRRIGISEIVFIDPRRQRVRYLRQSGEDYDEVLLTIGPLEFACVPGFIIQVEWLFADTKPVPFTLTKQLIEVAEAAEQAGRTA